MWGIYIFSRAEGHRQKSADFLGCSQILKSQCPSTFTIHYIYTLHITVSKESVCACICFTYYGVKKDLLQCQTRPITVLCKHIYIYIRESVCVCMHTYFTYIYCTVGRTFEKICLPFYWPVSRSWFWPSH